MALLCSALIGCAATRPGVESSVTVFHSLPGVSAGTGFAIVPQPMQSQDLEFASYRARIEAQLVAHGWQVVPREQAQCLVSVAYAIDQGRVATATMPVWGQTGISGATTFGTVNATTTANFNQFNTSGTYRGTTTFTPSYGIAGFVPVSRMEYSRVLEVQMVAGNTTASEQPQRIYQGTVHSVGSSGALAVVMPAMIEALFSEFPGTSGSTHTARGRLQ